MVPLNTSIFGFRLPKFY